MSDPRRGHPGHDPSVPPPKRSKIMGVEVPPNPTIRESQTHPVNDLWHAAKRWSPAGLAAALLIVFFAIGGHEGVTKLAQAFSRADALTAEIKGLREDLAVERTERAKVMARLHAVERNVSSLCDFVSEMNGGRPNPTWCSADSRSIRVDQKLNPPPLRTTGESWVYVE